MRNIVLALPVVALALGGSTACATKKFVRTNVGEVNDKVETLSKSVEENQERARQAEGRISEVDQKAEAANRSATAARSAADAAAGKADTASARAEEVDEASRKLIFEVVLSEDQGEFKFGKADLPDTAKTEIDQMVEQLKSNPKMYFIEIEGHTDNVGNPQFNEQLGQKRAEAVKHYLYEHHQVPLHKMNVISYGESKPVSPNKTKSGRAQNRRVVIKVLA